MSNELMELPEGWKWAALEDISDHISGTAFKSTDFTTQGIQVIRLGNVYKGQLNLNRDPVFLPTSFTATSFVLKPGNIIVSQTGTRFKRDYGHFVLIPENAPKLFLNQRLLAISCHSSIEPEYVVLASKLKTYQDYFFSQETGGVNQGNVGVAGVMKGSIPLAPANEQKRIVAQIEALRERSQKAKAALEAIPELCDRFRQSVLAAAFRGDLTADWREQNPDVEPASVLLDRFLQEKQGKTKSRFKNLDLSMQSDLEELPRGWCWATFDQISERVTVGHVGSMKNEYVSEGIPFLRSQNVRENKFDPVGLQFISKKFHEKLSKSTLHPGDLVVVRSGSVGTACVIPDNLVEANCSDLVIVKQPKATNAHYGSYYMNSVARSHVNEKQVGIALTHFNTKSMAQLPIPVAPHQEQEEIVRRVQSFFKTVDLIQQAHKESKEYLERLNQSILAKAFRGELVEQDPNDEPASVLLDRIRAEREAQQPAKKSQRKGTAGRKQQGT